MQGLRLGVLSGTLLLLAGAVVGCPAIHGDLCSTIACGDTLSDAGDAQPDVVDVPDADVDFCAWDRETAKSHAVAACARLVSCQGGFGDTTAGSPTGACIAQALMAYDCTVARVRPVRGATRAYWDCLWRARTCEAIDRCVFGKSAPLCPSGPNSGCSDNKVHVSCASNGAIARGNPCVATGRTCANTAAVGYCTGTSGLTCADTGCEGTQLHACDSGDAGVPLDRGFDCASFGAETCVDTAVGPACRVFSDRVCTPTKEVTCTGDVARGCPSGLEEEVDCAGLAGTSCTPTSTGDGWDVSRACGKTQCSGDACAGDTLQACVRGSVVPVDCTSLGLKACAYGACAP